MDQNDKEFIQKLFKSLDTNNDGRLTREEIKDGFFKLKIPSNNESIDKFIQSCDDDKDGTISYPEFEKFTNQNLIQLKKIFNDLDSDHNGSLDAREIEESIKKLGIPIYSEQDISRLLHRIDTNHDSRVDFNEWRELLVLLPTSNLAGILSFWKDAQILDPGTDLGGSIPPPPRTDKSSLSSTLNFMLAGAISGFVSRTLTAPMERVKIIYQVSHDAPKSLVQTFKDVYRDGGFRGLFRGNLANCLKVAPESAVKFATFEAVKRLFAENDSELNSTQRFLAGAAAGVASHTSLFPLEVVRTRLSASTTGTYNGIIDCFVKTAKSEGYFRPFYRGLTASILSTIPHSGINMLVYETLKHEIIKQTKNPYPTNGQLLACASASSVCGQLVSYPIHIIKCRLITQGTPVNPEKYTGLIDGLTKTFKKEGIRGLYRGITPNFLKAIPSHSISFMTYEILKKQFNIQKEKKH